MKGYVAVPVRLPTGELTGYIGITEGKVPKEFHLSRVVTFPKKMLRQRPAEMRGFLFARLQRDRSRQAARISGLKRRQPSSIACHSRREFCGSSLGHLSGSYCILQSVKTSRPRPCAPSTQLPRGASNFAQDCTQPVDGTANPLPVSVGPFSSTTSLSLLSTTLFLLLRQSHYGYEKELFLCWFRVGTRLENSAL